MLNFLAKPDGRRTKRSWRREDANRPTVLAGLCDRVHCPDRSVAQGAGPHLGQAKPSEENLGQGKSKGKRGSMIEAPVRHAPTRETHRKLEESGRVTPREVITAYEEEGATPIQGNFSTLAGGMCPASVLAVHEGLVLHGKQILYRAFFINRFDGPEMAALYREGFIAGVDAPARKDLENHPLWRRGFFDGRRAWSFVASHF